MRSRDQFVLALLQRGLAKLPAFLQILLALLVLLLLQTDLFVVAVLGFLALELLLVLVVLDLALPLLFERLVLLFPLALGRRRGGLPLAALFGDFGLQTLLFGSVVPHHLVEGRGRDIDVVQSLQLRVFEGDGGAHRRQQFHFGGEFLGDARERLGYLESHSGDALHHALHGDPVHCLAHAGFLLARRLFGFRIGGFPRGLHLLLDLSEFPLHFRLAPPPAGRRFRRFRRHGMLS